MCEKCYINLKFIAQADGCSPERAVAPDGRGGGAPALASALVPLWALAAQWRGHVGRLVALVGQVLVERQGRARLADRRAPRQHVVLAHVRHPPVVVREVGLRVAAAAWGYWRGQRLKRGHERL